MKYVSIALLLLSICNQLSAMQQQKDDLNNLMATRIQISDKVIRDRLYNMHFKHFVDSTRIHKTLGNIQLSPIGFALGVSNKIDSYLKNLRIQSSDTPFLQKYSTYMQDNKDLIIRAILRNYPKEIDKLTQHGFIKEPIIKPSNFSNQPKKVIWSSVIIKK